MDTLTTNVMFVYAGKELAARIIVKTFIMLNNACNFDVIAS